MNSSLLRAKSTTSLPSYEYPMRAYTVARCSPYTRSFSILRDAPSSWEAFSMQSLPQYLSASLQKLQDELRRFEDPAVQYTVADEDRLTFMIEALIQARRLLADQRAESER